jgi:hypothetical protein
MVMKPLVLKPQKTGQGNAQRHYESRKVEWGIVCLGVSAFQALALRASLKPGPSTPAVGMTARRA